MSYIDAGYTMTVSEDRKTVTFELNCPLPKRVWRPESVASIILNRVYETLFRDASAQVAKPYGRGETYNNE